MTQKLSHASVNLVLAMAEQVAQEVQMNDMTCPWCETDLVLRLVSDEQTCAQCGTTWSYEEEEGTEELLLAA